MGTCNSIFNTPLLCSFLFQFYFSYLSAKWKWEMLPCTSCHKTHKMLIFFCLIALSAYSSTLQSSCCWNQHQNSLIFMTFTAIPELAERKQIICMKVCQNIRPVLNSRWEWRKSPITHHGTCLFSLWKTFAGTQIPLRASK